MVNKFIENPWRIFNVLAAKGVLVWLPDKPYLKLRYRATFNKKLNLKDPQTFSEKLQWLKLYDRKPKYMQMVDKYEVKKYVSQIIGEKYIIPTLGVWERFDDIDFDILPKQFVIKCTHDSGGLVICKDKNQLNIEEVRKKIERSLKHNYYKWGREWAYKNVRPRIIAEVYMDCGEVGGLTDYKFYCFNGKPLYCQVIKGRYSEETIDFFDMDWQHQNFTGLGFPHKPNSRESISCPCTFKKMKDFARKLSKDTRFVRIDFYEVAEQLYFGEITFYPSNGFGEFSPIEKDRALAQLIINNEENLTLERR